MKRYAAVVAAIASVTVVLVSCGSSAPASSDGPRLNWHRIDTRVQYACYGGVVLFWSDANGDITSVPWAQTGNISC